jgi:hypothetical protein
MTLVDLSIVAAFGRKDIMGIRLSVGVAALLIAILANDVGVATAGEPGRLAAFTARKELRDEVCIAMAGGHISRADRYTILVKAKAILKPEEYEGLKRAMDRLSPSPAIAARKTAVAAQTASRSSEQATAMHAYSPLASDPSLRLSVPTDVSLPDRVAWASDMR